MCWWLDLVVNLQNESSKDMSSCSCMHLDVFKSASEKLWCLKFNKRCPPNCICRLTTTFFLILTVFIRLKSEALFGSLQTVAYSTGVLLVLIGSKGQKSSGWSGQSSWFWWRRRGGLWGVYGSGSCSDLLLPWCATVQEVETAPWGGDKSTNSCITLLKFHFFL